MAVALDQSRHSAATPRRSGSAVAAGEVVGQVARLLRVLPSLLWTTVVVVALFAFLALAVGPHVLGYRTATMLSASMAPGINPGDVVVSVPEPASEVAVGDVISFHVPVGDHWVETHRVVEVTEDADGRPAVVTQGDANPARDPWVATLNGDTVWQTKLVVPHVGSWIREARSPLVQQLGFWGALLGLVIVGLRRIWAPARPSGSGD